MVDQTLGAENLARRPVFPIPDTLLKFIAACEDRVARKVAVLGHGEGQRLEAVAKVFKGARVHIFATVEEPIDKSRGWIPVITGDPITELENSTEQFDRILCFPAWGVPPKERLVRNIPNSVPLRDKESSLFAAIAGLKLTDDGICYCVSEREFFGNRQPHSLLSNLEALQLSIRASIEIPNGSFAPVTNIGGCLLILSRGRQDQLFVGELTYDPLQVDQLAKNFVAGREGKLIESGIFVSLDSFNSFSQMKLSKRVFDWAERSGIKLLPANHLFTDISPHNQASDLPFKEIENSIFLPTVGNSSAVLDHSQATVKPQNLIQLVVNTDVVDPAYLAAFLNTNEGMLWRQSVSTGTSTPSISKSGLTKAEIPLPDKQTQMQLLRIDSSARLLQSQFDDLRAGAWRAPKAASSILNQLEQFGPNDTLRAWVDEIPYPLASILWRYLTTSESDYKSRYECLLHFFEAYTEFVSAILISAAIELENIIEGVGNKIRQALHAAHQGLEVPTFGTWRTILETTFKEIRRNQQQAEARENLVRAFAMANFQQLEQLISKRFVTAINSANQWRNSWHGHGGIVGSQEAADRHSQLESLLVAIRGEHKFWSNYQLFQPVAAQITDDGIEYEISLVQGRSFPFEKRELFLIGQLNTKDKELYLAAEGQSYALKLLPIVVLAPSPESAENACYFYNRVEGGKRKYVSYHFEKASEVFLEGEQPGLDFGSLFGGKD